MESDVFLKPESFKRAREVYPSDRHPHMGQRAIDIDELMYVGTVVPVVGGVEEALEEVYKRLVDTALLGALAYCVYVGIIGPSSRVPRHESLIEVA